MVERARKYFVDTYFDQKKIVLTHLINRLYEGWIMTVL